MLSTDISCVVVSKVNNLVLEQNIVLDVSVCTFQSSLLTALEGDFPVVIFFCKTVKHFSLKK